VGLFFGVSGLTFALGCGGGGSKPPNKIVTSGSNVQTVSMNSGVTGNYANGIFTTVTVCVPGSSTCQTIDNILVDTGSIGLRLISSSAGGQFNLTLPTENDSSNNPFAECTQFLDGSFLWGPVRTADIKITGETATSVPINIVGDPSFGNIPTSCSAGGTNDNNVNAFGANGVLGLNVFAQDCGPFCVSGTMPPAGLYYTCPTSGCISSFASLTQQVQNPVPLFPTDNNGYIVELPSIAAAGQPSATGSIVFGIGTQSNNAMTGAKVIPLDGSGLFTTAFKNVTYKFSFLDTGSNGYFFLDAAASGLPLCPDTSFFYCPSSTQNLTATAQSTANTSISKGINFSVANADNLFNSSNFIFGNLAGPNPSSFDWGLPFYFGRNTFEAIEGKSTSGGTGPYVAF
jgi:hypothetical protein